MMLISLIFACSEADDSGKTQTDPLDTDTTTPVGDNTAPTAPTVALSPEHPADGDDLTLTILTESTDADGDAVTYTYNWSVDGTARADLTGTSIGNAETADGQTWEVSVVPNDGTVDGPAGTASVVIGNQPPSAPVIHLEPLKPVYRDDIHLIVDAEAVDPEGDPLTTTIQWSENGLYYATRDGLTTIDGLYVDGGDTFSVVVTVTDGVNAPVSTSAEVTLANLAPTISEVHVSPGSVTDDTPITVTSEGDDVDGSTIFWRYVWYRDGVEAIDVGDVDTVPAEATSVGETWTVVAFATDGHAEVSQPGDQASVVIPWEGSASRQIFTMTLQSDGAGGFTPISGQWAVDYLSYGTTTGTNSCELAWDVEAVYNSRYCRTCDYSFDTTYTYDTSSVVDFGCELATMDGTGFFFFNQDYGQFNGYNEGPTFSSRETEISLRITPDSDVYSWDGTTLSIQTSLTSAEYDAYGYMQLYMYQYVKDATYN